MGFASQLVINTFSNLALQQAEASGDLELVREMSRAHNRGIVEFCAGDARLLPAGYVPISDLEQAPIIAQEALDAGCRVLIVASAPPPKHSPSHIELGGVWARAAEAGAPIALHVGGTGEVLDPSFLQTGRGKTPSFHGGEGPMQSLRVMALPNPAKTLLAALVYDGVFMEHPGLKVGVYELGATWLPSFMRELDAVARGFRNEPRLTKLDRLPSEFIAERVRVTPYPYEDVAWIMEQAGAQSCMFCSDYPHVEGGRDPIGRFDTWLENVSASARQRFYADNFAEFVGLSARTEAAA
jgi:predicted TIM-barrel fold metal-dependent hydrolase